MSGPDYTSLVPQYTFAETLAEQEAQLADNPLLQRMIASRKAKESDPHRPVYHYVNPENTLNDPNGLCFWQGRWHLFYQGYRLMTPGSTGDTPSAMTSSTGATFLTPSTPTRRSAASRARPSSRTTGS